MEWLRRGGQEGTSDETLRQLSSLLVAQTPKLKAFRMDCFLDRIARQVVGGSVVWGYSPGSSPGTVLARKFVHIRVTREGAQPVRRLRFENVDAHDALYLRCLDAASFTGGRCYNRYRDAAN